MKVLGEMPKILKRFTSKTPILRYALGEPWPGRGWWYATDGRVLVAARVKGAKRGLQHRPGRIHKPGSRCVPKIHGLLPDPVQGKWKPWPDSPATAPCTHCGGDKKRCEFCAGTNEALFSVGGRWLARRYYRRIGSLPGVEYQLDKGGETKALQFRWESGVGAVMPISRTYGEPDA